jgi:hypothetical protein
VDTVVHRHLLGDGSERHGWEISEPIGRRGNSRGSKIDPHRSSDQEKNAENNAQEASYANAGVGFSRKTGR